MEQIIRNSKFLVEPIQGDYTFVGTSGTTKWIIPELFDSSDDHMILDIGFGRGELAQILRNSDFTGLIQIDGIEGYRKTCLNPRLSDLFDNVWCGLAQEIPADTIVEYDYVFLMDVIEHLTPEEGKNLLTFILTNMAEDAKLVVSTPLWFFPQGHVEPGDLEVHKCFYPIMSFMEMYPERYNINPVDLVGMFVFGKKSLNYVHKCHGGGGEFSRQQGEALVRAYNLHIDEEWHEA
jgi:hypothetical protein